MSIRDLGKLNLSWQFNFRLKPKKHTTNFQNASKHTTHFRNGQKGIKITILLPLPRLSLNPWYTLYLHENHRVEQPDNLAWTSGVKWLHKNSILLRLSFLEKLFSFFLSFICLFFSWNKYPFTHFKGRNIVSCYFVINCAQEDFKNILHEIWKIINYWRSMILARLCLPPPPCWETPWYLLGWTWLLNQFVNTLDQRFSTQITPRPVFYHDLKISGRGRKVGPFSSQLTLVFPSIFQQKRS